MLKINIDLRSIGNYMLCIFLKFCMQMRGRSSVAFDCLRSDAQAQGATDGQCNTRVSDGNVSTWCICRRSIGIATVLRYLDGDWDCAFCTSCLCWLVWQEAEWSWMIFHSHFPLLSFAIISARTKLYLGKQSTKWPFSAKGTIGLGYL